MVEQLWKEYDGSGAPEARDKLIIACLPYVKSSAYRLAVYAAPSQDADDLVSAGIIGLMDALEKYDPAKGASFKNYARYRVCGSIIDEVRSMDWVPYSIREKARRIRRAMQNLEQHEGTASNEESVAEAVGMSLDKYRGVLVEINRTTLSVFDESLHDGFDVFADDAVRNPERGLLVSETEQTLGSAIERLPEKERLAVTLYYYEEMTMREIGEVLNVSESRVCQIHSSAILRLHTRLKCMDADTKRDWLGVMLA